MKEFMRKKNYPKAPIKLTDQNFDEQIKRYPLVVVGLRATHCLLYTIMEPIIEELAKKYQGRIVFGKLNATKNMKIPKKYGIKSIPTLLIFKNGKLVDKLIGLRPKSMLESKLDEYMGNG